MEIKTTNIFMGNEKVAKNPFAKIYKETISNGGTLPEKKRKEMMIQAVNEVRNKTLPDNKAE